MYLLFPLSDVVKESGTVPITFLTKVDMTSNQKDSNAKKVSLFLLATIFILATALRFFHLDRDLGGNDENAMLLYFGYSPLKIIATNYWDANNHIFHTLLVRFMGVWFGEENSIAIRLPTLLFGLAGLWMVYRIALELFNSQLIARMALLIATVNPIHIHYSQTARGYSLIIFFSAAMILLSLKILRSEIVKGRGILITICGFLSVYTIPTNIFFLLGLGVWVIAVLFLPDPKDKFFKSREERREKGVFFLKIAVVISILCSVAYAPLLKQMVATIRNHQLMGVETQWNSIPVLIPAVLERVFPDNLMLFLPLLIFGFFYKKSRDHFPQFLPLIIFFLPFAITLINGVGGYPRNYLFNFPLLIVLMAAGMGKAGDLCSPLFKNSEAPRWIALGICSVYCILSVNTLFHKYYPSLKIPNKGEYRKNIVQHTQSHDLIAVQSPKNYIYARKRHRNNLLNILNDNQLDGFHLITPRNYDLFEYAPGRREKVFSIIQRLWSSINFETISLDKENKMTLMTNPVSRSLIPDHFERATKWKVFRGKGTATKLKMANTQDQMALKLETSAENEMLIMGSVPGVVSVSKPSIVVLVWTVEMKFNELIIQPNLVVDVASPRGTQSIQVNMSRINERMNIYLSHGDSLFSSSDWFLRSSIGVIPPGNYSFSIWLKCNKGQTLIYDEFRLFIIELADKK